MQKIIYPEPYYWKLQYPGIFAKISFHQWCEQVPGMKRIKIIRKQTRYGPPKNAARLFPPSLDLWQSSRYDTLPIEE
jgi:hypothetical protein